ncbi:cyclin-P [Bombina bombina]|uniref:cyclin-P n=1 Tax=Bombina bombina TaxID=8345 RepID=UPI00235A5A0F|nr:cyclin-P [Bombina bombina]
MDGKRELLKLKDSNRIWSRKDERKKRPLVLCANASVTERVGATVVSLQARKAPESNNASPPGPSLSKYWAEELTKAMSYVDMPVEREYVSDAFMSMVKNQSRNTFRSCDIPKAVTAGMRAVLVNWIVQVHEYLGLEEETLYLAVYLMNSYMKVHRIRTPLLQLLATACLYLACKLEESLIPEPAELCFMMEDSFSKKELLKMERKVLCRLRFDLHYTQPLHFLNLLSMVGKCPDTVHYLAMYLMELTLLEADGVLIEPALLAISALTLAQKVSLESGCLNPDQIWHTAPQLYSYSDSDLSTTQQLMAKAALLASSSETKSTFQKYSRSQKLGVSTGPALANSKHLARCMGAL